MIYTIIYYTPSDEDPDRFDDRPSELNIQPYADINEAAEFWARCRLEQDNCSDREITTLINGEFPGDTPFVNAWYQLEELMAEKYLELRAEQDAKEAAAFAVRVAEEAAKKLAEETNRRETQRRQDIAQYYALKEKLGL